MINIKGWRGRPNFLEQANKKILSVPNKPKKHSKEKKKNKLAFINIEFINTSHKHLN